MNATYHITGDFLDSKAPMSVEICEDFVMANGMKYTCTVEQEYPFVVTVTGEDNISRTMIVKLDSRGNPIVSYSGYSYPMDVLNDKENQLNKILLSGLSGKSIATKIPAPMPGLIKVVGVQVGQKVKKGEQLFVLEAMKMENSIKSPVSGILTSIAVQSGGIVDKNSVLCVIEPEIEK
ncbi:MAG: acetyl-CoA carboxylase biotin carboxyl carrier protein subunit [Ignavibacteria bacterium]|nr:acetyl-CoA carboxylase biotin carboxyl carrier protein subunit [Ignavibacteria bacterium]